MLEAIQHGETEVDFCLKKYPQYEEELRGYLKTIANLRALAQFRFTMVAMPLSQSWKPKTVAISNNEVAPTPPIPGVSEFRAEALKLVDICRYLSNEQLSLVAALGSIEERQAEETFGVEGGQGDSLYIILEGQVEVMTSTPMGQLAVRIARPNESLPLAAILGTGSLITSAVALTKVQALMIPRDRLLDLCRQHTDIGFQIFHAVAEILADRYRSTLNRLSHRLDKLRDLTELWVNV